LATEADQPHASNSQQPTYKQRLEMIGFTCRALADSWGFFREHGVIHTMKSREVPGLIQFGKYALCGVIATLVHITIVYSIGLTLNPAIGEHIPKELKETRTMWNNTAGFFLSGVVAYLLNVAFVFTPGRHGKRKEIGLFYLISAIAFFAGLFAIPLIFQAVDTNKNIEHYANLGFIVSSALVNFVCRKFIVFKG
jgi:putative flippase GtrA